MRRRMGGEGKATVRRSGMSEISGGSRATFGSRYTDFVQRRRDEACFAVWGMGFLVAWVRGAEGFDLIRLEPTFGALLAWTFVVAGVGLRVWAAGNMEKNRFTRPVGPYLLVRHPLYLGTLLISLGFFCSLGMPFSGFIFWLGLFGGVFYPVLRKEERELGEWFPGPYGKYMRTVPGLLPNPMSLGRVIGTSRFSFKLAGRNFGWRALAFVPLVPALSELLRWITSRTS